MSSFFSEFDSAPVGYGRSYLSEGDYVVSITEIKEIKAEESKQGKHSFVAAYKVIANDGKGNPVGSEASWVQTIPEKVLASDPKAKERALGTIKQFLAACLGDLGAFDAEGGPKASELFQLATSAAQPLRGTNVRVRVRTKVTKAGNDFSVHSFAPIDG